MKFLRIKCPICQRRLKVDESRRRKSLVCPKCNTKFKLDEEQKAQILSTGNDLFGPPVNEEPLDQAEPSDPFGNIDSILDSAQKKEKPNTEIVSSNERSTGELRPTLERETWDSEIKDASNFEDSLGRNGVGLLILAVGLSMLPFATWQIPGFEFFAKYIPGIAILIGFLACFMVAYSKRRSSIATICLALLPLLFICAASAGAMWFQSNFAVAADKNNDDLEAVLNRDEEEVVDNKDDDALDFNVDEINENVATQFVPPSKSKNSSHRSRPATHSKEVFTPPNAQPAVSEPPTKPKTIAPVEFEPEQSIPPDPQPVKTESNTSEKEADSLVKWEPSKILEKLKDKWTKGMVVHNNIRSPNFMQRDFELTEVIGETTVYGRAWFDQKPIDGLHALTSSTDEKLAKLLPAHLEDEPIGSFFAPDGFEFGGINVHLSSGKLRGVQGIFRSRDRRTVESQWIGAPAEFSDIQTIQIFKAIHGIVIYRNQMDIVGIRLIVAR